MQPLDLDLVDLMIRVVVLDNFKIYSFHSGSVDRLSLENASPYCSCLKKQDGLHFLSYCPSKRDRCYHTLSKDSSCRPHELLTLRAKDVVFKTSGAYQYAEITVNGKTGTRTIPLFSCIPYLKDWIFSLKYK
jgi:hypothetical protein